MNQIISVIFVVIVLVSVVVTTILIINYINSHKDKTPLNVTTNNTLKKRSEWFP